MNNRKRVFNLSQTAIIAALYAALTFAQQIIFPGSTSAAVQFRVSEALCILSVFTPAAIPGLTIGCAVSNIANSAALPLDVVLGSLATLLACACARALRNVTIKNLPVLSALMPAVFNGIIIGLEIEIFMIEGPFHPGSFLIQGGLVALGEAGVLLTLGLLLFKVIKKRRLDEIFFKNFN